MKKYCILFLMVLFVGCGLPTNQLAASSAIIEGNFSSDNENTSSAEILRDYLYEKLSKDDYAYVEWVDRSALIIHYINYDNVMACIEGFNGILPNLAYQKAKFSSSLLTPIMMEIADLPIVLEHMDQMDSIAITGEGLEIIILDGEAFPEIFEWISTYSHRALIQIRELKTNQIIYPKYVPSGAETSIEDKQEWDAPSESLLEYLNSNLASSSFSYIEQEGQNLFIYYNQEDYFGIEAVVKRYPENKGLRVIYIPSRFSVSELQPVKDDIVNYLSELGVSQDYEVAIKDFGVQVKFDGQIDPTLFLKWCSTYEQRNFVTINVTFPPLQSAVFSDENSEIPNNIVGKEDGASLFEQYLLANLPRDSYSHFTIEAGKLLIYCTNRDNIEQIVKQYKNDHGLEVVYRPSQFSNAQLEPVLRETQEMLPVLLREMGVSYVDDPNYGPDYIIPGGTDVPFFNARIKAFGIEIEANGNVDHNPLMNWCRDYSLRNMIAIKFVFPVVNPA